MVAQYRASRESSSDTAAPKSFAALTGNLPTITLGYAAHAAHYRKFLATISAALGGEAAPDELSHTANTAFRILQALPSTSEAETKPAGPPGLGPPGLASGSAPTREVLQRARTLLTTGVGQGGSSSPAAFTNLKISDETIGALVQSHTPLAAWLKQHRGGSRSSQSGGRGDGGAHAKAGPAADGSNSGGWRERVGAPRITEYRNLLRDDENSTEEPPEPDPEPPAPPSPPAAPSSSSAAAAAPSGEAAEEGTVSWVREVCRTHLSTQQAIEGLSGDIGQLEVDMLAATLIDRMHAPLSDEMVQEALIQVCVCISPAYRP